MKGIPPILLFFFLFIACKSDLKTDSPITIESTIPLDSVELPKPIESLSAERLLGKIDYTKDSLFVLADSKFTSKPIYLNKECYQSFIRMYDSAKSVNINLKIISGTRNFYEQKAIWERKWETNKSLNPVDRSKKILEYSSMPGTSRHHWGTDIDLNNLNNTYFANGQGKKEYDWLTTNANHFGFYQVYTSKENGRSGYNEEKWHWSYLPVAFKFLNAYNQQITFIDIDGFLGFETATELNCIVDYVNGISEKAKSYKD